MKKYYLIARDRDTNSFSVVKLKEKWYKFHGSDEKIRGHLLSDIDLVTTRFSSEEEMANMMYQNGYILSVNVDCYIVSLSSYHGKEYIKTKEVLYRSHDSKRIDDLRMIAKYYSNPNSYPHPSGLVDHLLDKFCTKAFYNEEFRHFVLFSLDTLPKNITRYFQKSDDLPPYRMKYESSWAKDNYSVLRSMIEAFERFDIFTGKDRQGQYMNYLNSRNPYRKKIEDQIKRQIDPKNVEGQISLMDYEEFNKPTSSSSLLSEVDDITKKREIKKTIKNLPLTLFSQTEKGCQLKNNSNFSNTSDQDLYSSLLSTRLVSIMYQYALHSSLLQTAVEVGGNTNLIEEEIRRDEEALNKRLKDQRTLSKVYQWCQIYRQSTSYENGNRK